ncbi:MAG: hypothetical protein ACOX25_01315 [Caldicoprobacterales bacterium]
MRYPLFFYPVYKERIWGGRKTGCKNTAGCWKGIGLAKAGRFPAIKNGMGIIRNGELKGIRLDEAIEKVWGENCWVPQSIARTIVNFHF